MGKFRLAFFPALLLAGLTGTQATEVTDMVPGHPGITYEMLLKQALPSLAEDKDGNWTALGLQTLRGTDGKIEKDTDLSFGDISVLSVKEGGRKRLLLLSGDSRADGSFSAILAAYDDTVPTPKLLDFLDAGGDRFVLFSSPPALAIAPGTDAFLVDVNHFNSNQNYSDETIYYLDGGRLKVATSQFTLNQGMCGYEMRQVPVYAVHDDKGAKYRAISISVTQTTTHTDETCDEGTKLPKAGKVTYTDVYRWDAKKNAYVTPTPRSTSWGRTNSTQPMIVFSSPKNSGERGRSMNLRSSSSSASPAAGASGWVLPAMSSNRSHHSSATPSNISGALRLAPMPAFIASSPECICT